MKRWPQGSKGPFIGHAHSIQLSAIINFWQIYLLFEGQFSSNNIEIKFTYRKKFATFPVKCTKQIFDYLHLFVKLSNCIDWPMTMIYITNGHKLPVLSGLKRLCLQFVKFSHNCGPLVVPCAKFICRNLSNKGFFSIFVCYSLMQNQTIHRVTNCYTKSIYAYD